MKAQKITHQYSQFYKTKANEKEYLMAFPPSHMERIRIICSVLIRTATTHWFLVRNSPRIIEKKFQWFANNIDKECVCFCAAKVSIPLFTIPIIYINLKYFKFDKIKMIFLVIVNWCLTNLISWENGMWMRLPMCYCCHNRHHIQWDAQKSALKSWLRENVHCTYNITVQHSGHIVSRDV